MSIRILSLRSSSVRRSLMAALVLGLAAVFTIGSVGDSFARLGGGGLVSAAAAREPTARHLRPIPRRAVRRSRRAAA